MNVLFSLEISFQPFTTTFLTAENTERGTEGLVFPVSFVLVRRWFLDG